MQKFYRDPALGRNVSAFTMIEVLVVILIIGIIINFAVISIRGNSPTDVLKAEARRFTSLVELALEEALLRSELVGIVIEEDAYHFLVRDQESWEPNQESIFRKRELPENIRFEIITEQPAESNMDINKNKDTEAQTPDIVLLSSGEITPFELKVSSDLTDDFFRINGTETGSLQLDHVAPY